MYVKNKLTKFITFNNWSELKFNNYLKNYVLKRFLYTITTMFNTCIVMIKSIITFLFNRN